MSWTRTPLIDGAPSLKFADAIPDDVETHTAIYTKLTYKIFSQEPIWDAWTAWINDPNNHASADMIAASSTFSSYALHFTCALEHPSEGSGCCMRDLQEKEQDRVGGWCVYYRPVEDHKGNSAGYDAFHTYRLKDAEFDAFEKNWKGIGSSFEEVITESKLPDQVGGNNLEYLHLFKGEVDSDGEHWSASTFQPDYHVLDQTENLTITEGYPRFGKDDKAKAYYIDRGQTIEPLALRIETIYLNGAFASLFAYSALIASLIVF